MRPATPARPTTGRRRQATYAECHAAGERRARSPRARADPGVGPSATTGRSTASGGRAGGQFSWWRSDLGRHGPLGRQRGTAQQGGRRAARRRRQTRIRLPRRHAGQCQREQPRRTSGWKAMAAPHSHPGARPPAPAPGEERVERRVRVASMSSGWPQSVTTCEDDGGLDGRRSAMPPPAADPELLGHGVEGHEAGGIRARSTDRAEEQPGRRVGHGELGRWTRVRCEVPGHAWGPARGGRRSPGR